ncbi:AAA family ATPase [Paenibacillus cellulositrophicus]|uniref:AAA family ATPase n=1 Tax=Paenibacillus cellulositrophicus TaxID=562959 RepID=UPI003F804DB4
MKPITLKLSGLQSYREMQQIDFDELCQMGLFGIFGPTGSGKSTLLDAMTLALYGKVERAVNGTQGIMNHSEDALYVSFTFELSSADGQKRYRVERRFKRTNELSVSNTVSRFIEVTAEGETVMADKLAEVTRCVEDKIGLKMEDFTRAVVLPQGKFAEFLSLKGSERRQMLQRLFHLEKYGDLLAQKLSRRVKDNDAALKEVEAEQQGLGSAGAEAVDEARNRLKEASMEAEASRLKLRQMTEEAEKAGKFREMQLEKERREQELQQLSAEEEAIVRLERRLGQSAAARAIMPLYTQWTDSRQEWDKRIREAEQLQTKAEAADTAAREAAAADDASHRELAAEEPKLLQRQEQLEQAVLLQRERDELKTVLQQLAEQRSKTAHESKERTEALAKEQELLAKGLKRQSELQESLKGLEVKAKDRERLNKAMRHVQQLGASEQRLRSAEAELKEHGEKQSRAEALLKQAGQEREQHLQEQKRFALAVSAHMEQVLGHDSRMEAALSRLDQEEALVRSSSKERELHALSLALAAELRPGEPCPVCGSSHHPAPASPGQDAPGADDGLLELLRLLRQQLQELRLSGRQLVHETRSLLESYEPGAQVQAEAPSMAGSGPLEGAGEAAAALEIVSDPEQVEPFSRSAWESRIRKMEEDAEALASSTRQLQREHAALKERGEALSALQVKRTAEIESLRETFAKLGDRFETEKREYLRLQEEWRRELPDLQPEQADRLSAEIQQKDAQAEEIRERLQISIPFIEEKTASVQSLERQINDLDKSLIQWDAQLQGKQDLLAEKERRLQAWVGSESADRLLEGCKQRLLSLREAAARSKEKRQAAEQLKHEAAKAAAMAAQAAESAEQHCRKAQARWDEQLAASPFATSEEVADACMPPDEEVHSAERVRLHREREQEIKVQLRHLAEQLDGRGVTEEEWQRISAELAACRERDETALQQRARAERDLDDVEKRHVRWSQLERIRKQRQQEAEKLSKLQSCLRGNAFVEYIAEEQLMQVSQAASQRLRFLTKQRYALEVDSGGGFLIRDDANGGVRRPVSTLSGGETFLTSLSLALALSAQIQLRGQYPLQFFFLDEGFGTLDPELLDTVITSLEKLHNDHLSVGIISHVPELRARLPRKLIVVPAEQAGGGSRIVPETL